MVTPTKPKNLQSALAEFQSKLVKVGKTAENPFHHSKYAPLPEILKAVQPVLAECGLVVTQFPSHINGLPALTTAILHPESGEREEHITPLVLSKQDPQAHGSAITYMRRYSLASALQIVIDEDDDGNKASNAQFNASYVQDAHPVSPVAKIKEQHLSGAPQISPTIFQELCFLPSKLKIPKETAKELWNQLYKLGVYRGKFNLETKTWSGTDIKESQVPVIVGLFADTAGYTEEQKQVLIQQFTGDSPVDEYSDEPF